MKNPTQKVIHVLAKTACITAFVLLCISFGAFEKMNINNGVAADVLKVVIPIGVVLISIKIIAMIIARFVLKRRNAQSANELWGCAGLAFLLAGLVYNHSLITLAILCWVVGAIFHTDYKITE
ncbi:MAG: hypothetical protein LBR25_09845 [Erysipelotrichaceae bacterium]|nr:hypothetical protein [Erysipelotrichaceae bacterium]